MNIFHLLLNNAYGGLQWKNKDPLTCERKHILLAALKFLCIKKWQDCIVLERCRDKCMLMHVL